MEMNIMVFGAAGTTGRVLTAQALAKGYLVTAFCRTPEKLGISHASLRVIQGDVSEPATVQGAIQGQDAVLSALGNASPLKRELTLVNGVDFIVRQMERTGPRRLIYLSFLGVRDGRGQLSFLLRNVLAPALLRNEVADHEAKESLIKNSGLDWTIVRPPKLTNGPHTRVYRHGVDIKASSIFPMISRADVCDFMLKQLSDRKYVRKAPAVMH